LRTLVDEHIPETVRENGTWLLDRLRAIESARIRDVRGLGLLVGIELKEPAGPFLQALLERGIVALAAGPTVIRLLPPLVITREELEEAVDAIEAVLA
jgi:acetylornithine/LysW-gamma-L-lysine aminotransferase